MTNIFRLSLFKFYANKDEPHETKLGLYIQQCQLLMYSIQFT